jgi:hypothetical protein
LNVAAVILILAGVIIAVVIARNASGAVPRVPSNLEPPPYQTQTISVPARQVYTLTMPDVRTGQTIEGSFDVVGGNSDIGFRLRTPDGGSLVSIGRVAGSYSFRYTASLDGTYALVFDNSFSLLTPKNVTVRMRWY